MRGVKAWNQIRWILKWVSELKIRICRGQILTWCPCQKWQLFPRHNHTPKPSTPLLQWLSNLRINTSTNSRIRKIRRMFRSQFWELRLQSLILVCGLLETLRLVDLWVVANSAMYTLQERQNPNSLSHSKSFTSSNSSNPRLRVSFAQRLKSRVISNTKIFVAFTDSSGTTKRSTLFSSLLQVWTFFKKWSNHPKRGSMTENLQDTLSRSSELSSTYIQRK